MGVVLEKNVGAGVTKALLRRLDRHMVFHHLCRPPMTEKSPDVRPCGNIRSSSPAFIRCFNASSRY
jgi:hypothetical protein